MPDELVGHISWQCNLVSYSPLHFAVAIAGDKQGNRIFLKYRDESGAGRPGLRIHHAAATGTKLPRGWMNHCADFWLTSRLALTCCAH
jgi:hypothetical protein